MQNYCLLSGRVSLGVKSDILLSIQTYIGNQYLDSWCTMLEERQSKLNGQGLLEFFYCCQRAGILFGDPQIVT